MLVAPRTYSIPNLNRWSLHRKLLFCDFIRNLKLSDFPLPYKTSRCFISVIDFVLILVGYTAKFPSLGPWNNSL